MEIKADTRTSLSAHAKTATANQSFKKIAFPKFRPAAVANKLLSQKPRHRNLQEVLFAGFCAWVLVPHSSDLRNYAMRLTARRIYDEACDELLGENAGNVAIRRWKKKDFRTFKKEIYDVLGGHVAMRECISSFDLEEELEKKGKGSDFVLRLAEIWHYAIESGSVNQNKKLSIVQSKDIAGRVGIITDGRNKSSRSGRRVESDLDTLNRSVAFRYAASATLIPREGTILDLMQEHSLTFEQAQPLIKWWFARAKYFDSYVLSRLAASKPGNKKNAEPPTRRHHVERFAVLSKLKGDPEAFQMPRFNPSQLAIIETVYKRPTK